MHRNTFLRKEKGRQHATERNIEEGKTIAQHAALVEKREQYRNMYNRQQRIDWGRREKEGDHSGLIQKGMLAKSGKQLFTLERRGRETISRGG